MAKKELYDLNKFPGVSQQTRTDIINTVGIDVNGLTLNEGGKFTEEELCEGLRYLIATNKDLHIYLEKSQSPGSNTSSSNHDPFYIPTSHDFFPYLLLNSTYSSGDSGVPSDGCHGRCDSDGAAYICIAITALALVAGFCYCTGKNTYSTIESNESNSVKTAKIILTLSVFAATFTLIYCFVPIDDEFIRAMVALPIAAALAAFSSYTSKKFPCLPKIASPEKELLDELQTVKQILERGYDRPGDNKEQCKQFVKEVVRYYIQTISKENNIELDQPHTTVIKIDPHVNPSAPLLPEPQKKYGTIFKPNSSVNDELSVIITEPIACCSLTN